MFLGKHQLGLAVTQIRRGQLEVFMSCLSEDNNSERRIFDQYSITTHEHGGETFTNDVVQFDTNFNLRAVYCSEYYNKGTVKTGHT